MKKILSVAIALCAISSLSAQKFSYGIKGGVNNNQLLISGKNNDGDKLNYSSGKVGFQIGGVAELSLAENFAVQPNLLFTLKGGAYPGTPYDVNIYSIELPVNLLYKTNGFFAGAGPNFGYGISAKVKGDGETVDLYKKDAEAIPLKRFEIGANIIMGYQFPSGLNISSHYTIGLNNTLNSENNPDDNKVNNRILGLSVGYTFGKK